VDRRAAGGKREGGGSALSPRTLLGVLGMLIAAPAAACGYCVEDKIASVYDHAVVTRALGRAHHVAYFALDGTAVRGESVRLAVESTNGVDRGSARVSAATGMLSLAFDPRRVPFATLEKRLQRVLAPQELTLLALRVMERPAELKNVSRR